MSKLIAPASDPVVVPFPVNRTRPPTPRPMHYADALSFMAVRKKRGTGIDHWLVKPTGRYGEDCATGRQLATEFLAYIRDVPTAGSAALLAPIVRDMIDRAAAGEQWSGVHVGFFSAINDALICLQLGYALPAE